MKKKYRILCFDIDGVICKTIDSKYKTSKPIKKNIEVINSLYLKGYYIKLFTARYMGRTKDNKNLAEKKAKNLTISQLREWNVKYNKIYCGKISYDLIIDDKSIFHSNKWAQKINKYLKKNVV